VVNVEVETQYPLVSNRQEKKSDAKGAFFIAGINLYNSFYLHPSIHPSIYPPTHCFLKNKIFNIFSMVVFFGNLIL
jgi:hypothetical protein